MDTMETILTFNYTLIGVAGALSVLVFTAGLSIYLMRLGTERRVYGIHILAHSVRIIIGTFVLIGILYLIK